jgi:hypothetical protein
MLEPKEALIILLYLVFCNSRVINTYKILVQKM